MSRGGSSSAGALSVIFMIAVITVPGCGESVGHNDDAEARRSTTVFMQEEAPGSNCPNGGVAVHTYYDANGDGKLTEDEIIETVYVCHGSPGESGQSGPTGPAGSPCTATDNGDGTKTIDCEDGTSVTVSDGDRGDDGSSCTVRDNGDGTKTIECEDGTSENVSDGDRGDDGSSCTLRDNGDGTKTIECEDGTSVTVSDGDRGDDGSSCTVRDNGDGTKTIECEDGTSVTVNDGEQGADGSSCTVRDNGDGTKTIECEDGTSVTVSDGHRGDDGSSCTVRDNGDGTKTIECEDGTSVTVNDGEQGDQGTPGEACTIVDNGDGSHTLSCPDGTEVTFHDGQVAWVKRAGGNSEDRAHCVAVGPDGSAVMTGEFRATADFADTILTSAGWEDIFLAKYDSNGGLRWVKRFGAGSADWGHAVTVDPEGNVLLAAVSAGGSVNFGGSSFNGGLFLVKFDPEGEHLWTNRLAQRVTTFGDHEAHGLVTDAEGNIVIGGSFRATADFGAGPVEPQGTSSAFLAKYDRDGVHLWSKVFGSESTNAVRKVALDLHGNAYATGFFNGTVNMGGGDLTSAGASDVFLLKLDPDGQHAWSKRFGGTGWDRGSGVVVDSRGNVILTGQHTGVDFGGGLLGGGMFLASFDSHGNHRWSSRANGNSTGIAIDSSDKVIVTGWFSGTTDFGGGSLGSGGGNAAFVAKFDSTSGTHSWSKAFGNRDSWSAIGSSVAVDSAGAIYSAGEFRATMHVGQDSVTSAGWNDIYLLKLLPYPALW